MIEFYKNSVTTANKISPEYFVRISKQALMFDDVFKLGSTPCMSYTVSMAKDSVGSFDKIIVVEDSVQKHVLYLDSLDTSNDLYDEYVLTDSMIKFNAAYDGSIITDEGQTAVTYLQILQDICSTFGVGCGVSTFIGANKTTTTYDNTIPARDYISWLAEMNGGYAVINANDQLVFKQFGDSDNIFPGKNICPSNAEDYTAYTTHTASGGSYSVSQAQMLSSGTRVTVNTKSPSWAYFNPLGMTALRDELVHYPNTKFTISFDVYTTSNAAFNIRVQNGNGDSRMIAFPQFKFTPNVAYRVSATATTSSELAIDSQILYFDVRNHPTGSFIEIGNIQIEMGDVATPYEAYSPSTVAHVNAILCSSIKVGALHKIQRVVFDNYDFKFEHGTVTDGETLYLNIENRFITAQSDIDAIYNVINGFSFYNINVDKCPVERTSVGEMIAFDLYEDSYPTIAQIDQEYLLGWMGGYECEVANAEQQETQVVGTAKKMRAMVVKYDAELNQFSREISEINEDLGEVSSKVSTLEQDAERIEGQVTAIENKTDNMVVSSTEKYGYGTSPTTKPADSAFTYSTMPARQDGKYIWRKTVTVAYQNGTSTTTTLYEMIQGTDGESVTITSIQYASGTSYSEAPSSGWQNTPPQVADGEFLWTKTTYSDNTVAYSVAKQGERGQQGEQGEQGEQGVSVDNVKPLYYLKSALLNMELKGATSQDGTPTPDAPVDVRTVSGNNIIKITNKNIYYFTETQGTANGVDYYFDNEDGSIRASGTPNSTSGVARTFISYSLKEGTYFLSGSDGYIRLRCNLYDKSGALINRYNDIGNGVSFTITENVGYAWFGAGAVTANVAFDSVVYPQLEFGNAQTQYVQHTEKNYPINLPVKNLIWYMNDRVDDGITFDYDSESGGVHVSGTATANAYEDIAITDVDLTNYPYVPAGTYTASINSGEGAGDSNIRINVKYKYDDGTTGALVANVTKSQTFTMAQSGYIYVRMMVVSGGTVDEIVYPQIEKGSKVNAFQVYGAQQIELCKIGDYQDYIWNDNGSWKVHKATNSVDLSSMTWTARVTGTDTVFTSSLSTSADSNSSISNYKSNTMVVNYANNWNNATIRNQIGIYTQNTGSPSSTTYMRFLTTEVGTVQQLSSWLTEHPTYLYYPIGTPQDVDITDSTLVSQLESLSRATSSLEATNIVQINNDLPFDYEYDTAATIAPSAPTSEVTVKSYEPNIWTTVMPLAIQGYRYWTCQQNKFSDDECEWTEVVGYNFMSALSDATDDLKNELSNIIVSTQTKYDSDLKIEKDRINWYVEKVETIEKNYISEDGLPGQLEQLTVAYKSDVTTAEDNITETFSQTYTTKNEFGEYKTEVATMIRRDGDGIHIGRSDSEIQMNLGNDKISFDSANGDSTWLGAGDIGLGTVQLSVGSSQNKSERWKMFTRSNGTHFSIIRHS